MSQDKEILSDISTIFQENYDRIIAQKDDLSKELKELNLWLIKENDSDDEDKKGLLYQYMRENQAEFIEIQTSISNKLDAMYDVLKDVNSIVMPKSETPESQVQAQGEPSTMGRQIVNITPSQVTQEKKGKFDFLKRTTNIPKSLEDAYIRTEDLKNVVMNTPKLWQKFVDYHTFGVMRQKIFNGTGMQEYLQNEIYYLNSKVEPQISQIIKRASELMNDKNMVSLKEVYTTTLSTEKEIETAKLMTGQSSSES